MRYSFFTLLLCGLFFTQASFSLGLGDIQVESQLNEPFAASIAIHGAKDLTERELLIKLGDQAAFDRAGVERVFLLTQLVFTVQMEKEQSRVLITSDETIREPFLNLIVEVQWPKGQVFKEYTVFLNPN